MEKHIQAPPRLLLGATLLFWGAMTANPIIGLVVALLVESANWMRFRWDFGGAACSLAWRISMLLTIIAGTLIWLDGDRYTALPRLMIWLPLLLFPLQFVQSFGLRNWMALNNLSFFSKFHRKRNLRLGREDSIVRFNFGNVFFIITIVAASLGYYAQHFIFFPGLVALSAWLIFSRVKVRIFALLMIVLTGGAIGLAGQKGMTKLYHWATNRPLQEGGYPSTDPTTSKTSIGSLGELKQSSEMLWRVFPEPGVAPPKLLRLASYNRYKGINWKNRLPDPIPEDDENFQELTTIELTDGEPYYLMREDMSREDVEKSLPTFRMRGASASEEPIPLPGNAASLQDFELDGIEINPLGTVRIFPRRSIIEGGVRWNDRVTPDAPPYPAEDLEIDDYEFEGIREVAERIGLNDLPTTSAKIARLREFFTGEFEYTRYLTIHRARATQTRPTAIETFLTTSKRGHCEYFATSATLLLRAADVPARYCVGFSVMERNPRKNEWIVRGTHAHAWTRVWDESQQRWIDFDPTPPGWLVAEAGSGGTTSQWLADSYQRFKEDFFLWRNRPANRLGATVVMWVLGLSVITFVGRRLWKSKLVVDGKKEIFYGSGERVRTPLHDLEKPASKILSPRKPGETLVSWLAQLAHHGIPDARLQEAVSIHQSLRFDPAPPDGDQSARLREIAGDLRDRIAANGTRRT